MVVMDSVSAAVAVDSAHRVWYDHHYQHQGDDLTDAYFKGQNAAAAAYFSPTAAAIQGAYSGMTHHSKIYDNASQYG